VTAIDDLCLWVKVLTDPVSTTREVVAESLEAHQAHPLLPCVTCDGYRYACENYRFVHEGRVYGGKR